MNLVVVYFLGYPLFRVQNANKTVVNIEYIIMSFHQQKGQQLQLAVLTGTLFFFFPSNIGEFNRCIFRGYYSFLFGVQNAKKIH